MASTMRHTLAHKFQDGTVISNMFNFEKLSNYVCVCVSESEKVKQKGWARVSGSSGSRKFSFIHSSGIVPNSNFGVHGSSLSRPSTPSSTLSPTHIHTYINTLRSRQNQRTRANKRKSMQQHRSLLCDVFKPIKIITFKLCSLTNTAHTHIHTKKFIVVI